MNVLKVSIEQVYNIEMICCMKYKIGFIIDDAIGLAKKNC